MLQMKNYGPTYTAWREDCVSKSDLTKNVGLRSGNTSSALD